MLVQDGNGGVTHLIRDPVGRLTERLVSGGGGYAVDYTYDDDDRQLTVEDTAGKRTTYTYNSVDDRLTTEEAGGTFTTESHNKNHWLIVEHRNKAGDDGFQIDTSMLYDDVGRVTSKSITQQSFEPPPSTATSDYSFAYDRSGNLTHFQSNDTIYDTHYDAMNRATMVFDRASSNFADYKTFLYTYDEAGRVASWRWKEFLDSATFTYDRADRLKVDQERIMGNELTKELVYDRDGRQTGVIRGGRRTTISYDKVGNPLVYREYKEGIPGGHGIIYTYTYDGSNREQRAQGSRYTYTYNVNYQLTGQYVTSGPSWYRLSAGDWSGLTVGQWAELEVDLPDYQISTQYDLSGNPLVEVDEAGIISNRYDAGNRLVSRNDHGRPTTFAYDPVGRRTAEHAPSGRTTYVWDPAGQLSVALLPAGDRVTYTYGYGGLRRTRETPAGMTGYLWAGNNLLAETDGAGQPRVHYNVVPQGYGGMTTAFHVDEGVTEQLLFDRRGTVRAVSDAAGTVADQLFFDAFGNPKAGAVDQDFTWGYLAEFGYQRDPATGLYYVRRRWYDPRAKQFLSPDPMDPQLTGETNSYRYAGNDPLNRWDPEGLDYVSGTPVLFWFIQRPGSAAPGTIVASGGGVPGGGTVMANAGEVTAIPLGFDFGILSELYVLNPTFGGGLIHWGDAVQAAQAVLGQGLDLSYLPRDQQIQAIRQLLGQFGGGTAERRAGRRHDFRVRSAAYHAAYMEALARQHRHDKLLRQLRGIQAEQRARDDAFWRADNPWAWAVGVAVVAGAVVLIVATGGLGAAAVYGGWVVAAGAVAGAAEGVAQVYTAAKLEHRQASVGEYLAGGSLGAVFGAADPLAGVGSVVGSAAGGLWDVAHGRDFFGRGLQVGGLVGGLAGGGANVAARGLMGAAGVTAAAAREAGTPALRLAMRAAGPAAWRQAAGAGARHLAWEAGAAAAGAGVAHHYGYNPLLGAGLGTLAGGMLGGLGRRLMAGGNTTFASRRWLYKSPGHPNYDGITRVGQPSKERYHSRWLRWFPGLRRVSYPDVEVRIRPTLRGERLMSVIRHEQVHFRDLEKLPQLMALSQGYVPGRGVARYIAEFRGYSAELGPGFRLQKAFLPFKSFDWPDWIYLGGEIALAQKLARELYHTYFGSDE